MLLCESRRRRHVKASTEEMRDKNRARPSRHETLGEVQPRRERSDIEVHRHRDQPVRFQDAHHVRVGDGRHEDLVACSEAALSFDAGKWRRILENYVVAGERVLEPDRAGDARLLDALGASLRHEWLETDESLRARSAGLVPITDDNMGTEWGR